jgi:O-acetyl-ADP-ribose deacetylase (regulator of RNase III)/NAD-dependent SIR2 family protein deacetylase
MEIRVLSDGEVVRLLLSGAGRYALWLGAGVSADSGIQTAQAICDGIRATLLKGQKAVDPNDATAVGEWANRALNWSDPERRYTTCIRKAHPNPAMRVSYFRGLLRTSRPAFSHYAAALLMASDLIDRTCLTTNFDHLLERAFGELNWSDYQAVRSEAETQFWTPSDRRCFVVKLHGDIDTNNILNTTDETIELTTNMSRMVFDVVRNKGLLVLGAAGNEKSTWKIFESLEKEAETDSSVLSFGLLWGVYMGLEKPRALTEAQLTSLVHDRIRETGINRNIVELMDRSQKKLFAFFPVWGAGSFMFDVVAATERHGIVGTATRYLDHDMRLRHIFRGAGLSEDTVDSHLKSLSGQRATLSAAAPSSAGTHEEVLKAVHPSGRLSCRVIYGDITSRRLMSSREFAGSRRAVVSPEDTYISAGGGVAFGLLKKAGELFILNELSKLSPIPHRSVAVTSGGHLPVQYIVHAAALRIDDGPTYVASRSDVKATAEAALAKAIALDIGVLLIPLIGAGVASLSPAESLKGLFEAVRTMASGTTAIAEPLTIVIVIFRERLLPRHDVAVVAEQVLAGEFVVETV